MEALIEASASVLPAAYVEGLDAWRGGGFADALHRIITPTVVLGGADEQPLNPELLKAAVVAAIPGATFTALPGVGHYPQLEAPDDFARALLHASLLT